MAELGSHQLDACGILLQAVLGGKQQTPCIHWRSRESASIRSFTDGREVEDHIFLTYEYPGDTVVTYSSITTNEADRTASR